jgi:hypothetical protein
LTAKTDLEKEKMLSFSKKYLKLYSSFFNKQMDERVSTTPAQKNLYKGAIELLVKQNSPAGFNSSRSEIKHYVNSGCPGTSKEKIEGFIKDLANKNKDILKTMFSDVEILEWRIHQFSAFIESLQNESEERAQKLAQKSRYVERFLHNQMIMRSEDDISLHTVKESSERYLSENIETKAYETLINMMIKSNLNRLAVNSKNYNRESLEKIIWAQALMPIKTPGFAKLLAEIPSSEKLEFKLFKTIDMNHYLSMFVGDIGGESEKHSAWELIKSTILIRGIGDIESEERFDEIDNYPAIQLSKAFGVEQSNIFSKKEQIGVEENIEIVNNIYSNWTVHKKIFDLFSDDDKSTWLDWRFDGFGKNRKGNFSESIKQNERFLQALDIPDSSPETNQYLLLKSFNLEDRYAKYIQVIDTLLHYIHKNTSDTINLDTLIQQVILGRGKTFDRPFEEVINLEITPKESTSFEANVFPCNCENNLHQDCWGTPIKFKKTATSVKIIGGMSIKKGIIRLILELGVEITRPDYKLSEKNIEDSISNLEDTKSILFAFMLNQSHKVGQHVLGEFKLLGSGQGLPKIHPILIGPGDMGRLKSESPFTIVGSQEGNSRMAIVSGDEGSEERKPILMTDVAYVVKDGKAYEIEPADYEEMPEEEDKSLDDDEPVVEDEEPSFDLSLDDDEPVVEDEEPSFDLSLDDDEPVLEDEEPSFDLWWLETAESRSLRELLSQRIKSGGLSKEQIEEIRAILEGKKEDGE